MSDHDCSTVEELAAQYVLGALEPEDHARFEAARSEHCPRCEAELRASQDWALAIGSLAAAPPPPGMERRLFEAIEQSSAETGLDHRTSSIQVWRTWREPDRSRAKDQAAPEVVRTSASEEKFQEIGVPGVRVRRLAVDESSRNITMLVRMDPGSQYQPHRHAGWETCYVLEGDLEVGDGLHLETGDFQSMPAGSHHPTQRTQNGCLLLIHSSMDDQLLDG